MPKATREKQRELDMEALARMQQQKAAEQWNPPTTVTVADSWMPSNVLQNYVPATAYNAATITNRT